MAQTAAYLVDPLSRPKGAFTGHINSPSVINGTGEPSRHIHPPVLDGQDWDGDGDEVDENNSIDDEEDGGWRSELLRIDHSPPKVNPFHLLSHPDNTSPLPPLPPHLQSLAAETLPPHNSNGHDHHLANGDEGFNPIAHQFRTIGTSDGDAPLHITKVTKDSVQVVPGPHLESTGNATGTKRMMQKVGNAFRKPNGEVVATSDVIETATGAPVIVNGNGTATGTGNGKARTMNMIGRGFPMQGPPPSPPLSDADGTETEESRQASSVLEEQPPAHQESDSKRLSIFTSNLTAEPSDFANSPGKPFAGEGRRSSWNSGKSRTGSLAVVRNSRLAKEVGEKKDDVKDLPALPDQTVNTAGPWTAIPSSPGRNAPRISRRSTNPAPIVPPSPTIPPKRTPLLHSQSTFSSSPPTRNQTTVPGVDGAALDSDILAQAETIRRERLERRQKKASAAETVPEPGELKEKAEQQRKGTDEAKVLVGNLIGEDHVNYVLMYNMLTGIRIGVSRCQAKIKRPITEEDFTARHKFSFDIIGNELTPSARYDFKFKDYAPWVFRELRDEHFHLDPADYLLSLTAKYILSELGSPGKSGSFFYFSRDYRFIIKTISHSEHKFLRSILKDYYEHVKTNPHTLLSRFYGLHRVKLPRGRKIHFVIMNNLFPPHRDIHETYDLKGSAFGREYDEEKAKKNPRAVLKDKNWVNRGRRLELGPEKRALLSEQLRRDMEFLKRIRVMDYSLLVGIHNMERGNRDNLRENQLSVFHPEMPTRRKPTIKGPVHDARKAIRRSDPKMLENAASQLPSADSADRRHFLFYQDEGGLRATDEANQNMDMIYYLGVIDICTPYNSLKKVEHFWKSMTEDRNTISCVDPVTYGQRFLNFLTSIMRGGNPALRPHGLEEPTACEQRPVGEREKEDGSAAIMTNGTSHHHGDSAGGSKIHETGSRMVDDLRPGKGGGPSAGPGQRERNVPMPMEEPSEVVENGGAAGYGDGHADTTMAATNAEEQEQQGSWERPAMVGHLKAD